MKPVTNAILGAVLVSAVSVPTLGLFVSGSDRLLFAAENQWLWPAYLLLLAIGTCAAAIGLMRQVHWGYCAWSQLALSYLVFAALIGRMRREQGIAYRIEDGAGDAAIAASWADVLWPALIWLALALLPFAVRALWRRRRRGPSA